MLKIDKTRIECIERSEDNCYAKFIVEPLERGYGITLGNSIRRCLLSSHPRLTVTSVKIEGVRHKFSKIPGVSEGVMDIICNLKSLELKGYTDEPRVIRLGAQGGGIVRAADITTDSDIEILNPDLKLATLDRGGGLYMEMTVERSSVNLSADKTRTAYDGNEFLFAPILYRVNYEVEATRVGQITGYDKLTLHVWSNGGICPEGASITAARIMNHHLILSRRLNDEVDSVNILVGKEMDVKAEILEMLIEGLNLSSQSSNCLKRRGVNTLEDLTQKTEKDLILIPNFGRKSLEAVEFKLKELGLSLRRARKKEQSGDIIRTKMRASKQIKGLCIYW